MNARIYIIKMLMAALEIALIFCTKGRQSSVYSHDRTLHKNENEQTALHISTDGARETMLKNKIKAEKKTGSISDSSQKNHTAGHTETN